MSDVTVTIRTFDDQLTPVEIDSVLVRVYDNLENFVTEGFTGDVTPGEIQFLLPGDILGISYILRFLKAGVSFLPQPRLDIEVTDPAPAPFVVTGHVGTTAAIVTFVAKTTDVTPLPLPDTKFSLYSDSDLFITEMTADLLGEAQISLAAGSYIIRLLLPLWTFENGPTQTISVLDPLPVGGTNVFDFPASQPAMPVSSDPLMCRISGYLTDDSLQPLQRVKIRVMPILTNPDVKMSGFPGGGNPAVVGRSMILREAVFETDETGYVEMILPRDSCYEVHIHGYATPTVPTYNAVYVPNAAGAYIEDVFFPYTSTVVFDPVTLTLAIGETGTITPEITGSNTQTLDNKYVQLFMDFTVADLTVAGMAIGSSGAIVITGLQAGSTTLTVARSSKRTTNANRRPNIPALVVTPVTITVTP